GAGLFGSSGIFLFLLLQRYEPFRVHFNNARLYLLAHIQLTTLERGGKGVSGKWLKPNFSDLQKPPEKTAALPSCECCGDELVNIGVNILLQLFCLPDSFCSTFVLERSINHIRSPRFLQAPYHPPRISWRTLRPPPISVSESCFAAPASSLPP